MTLDEARMQYLIKLCHEVQSQSMYGEICRGLKPEQLPQLLDELKAQIKDCEQAVLTIVGKELFNCIKHVYDPELIKSENLINQILETNL